MKAPTGLPPSSWNSKSTVLQCIVVSARWGNQEPREAVGLPLVVGTGFLEEVTRRAEASLTKRGVRSRQNHGQAWT